MLDMRSTRWGVRPSAGKRIASLGGMSFIIDETQRLLKTLRGVKEECRFSEPLNPFFS